MSETILETRELSYRYGPGSEALVNLNLRVAPHRKVAVLGPNGAGKSTLFLCLNGTLRPQAGTVLLHGKPMGYGRRELTDWRRRVGLAFQDPNDQLIAGTVEQDVALGPLNLGIAPEAARVEALETLQALGLAALSDSPLHALSHGQRKLVAIAGVLAMHPELIVIDEPTAGLDPAGAEQLIGALNTIHRKGATLLISTHDMDFAYQWADEGIIISAGTVFHQGPMEALFSDNSALRQARLRLPRVLQFKQHLQRLGIQVEHFPDPMFQ